MPEADSLEEKCKNQEHNYARDILHNGTTYCTYRTNRYLDRMSCRHTGALNKTLGLYECTRGKNGEKK